MGTWNSNSWSIKENENAAFREAVLKNLDVDILCVNETFLVENDDIKITDYVWLGHNRLNIHKRAKRGSGGVGILLHNRVLHHFKIEVLSKEIEDVLWIKLIAKNSDLVLCLCSCYLPPKSSSHKVDGETFFNRLMDQVYCFQNEGLVCVCGDINARTGNMQDLIEGVDDVPLRNIIDASSNEYGDLFNAHLTTCNMCTLNGRAGLRDKDGYTCVSSKGRSVVDYAWVPYEQLHYWSAFQVHSITSLIDVFDLHPPARLPDHNIITWNFRLPDNVVDNVEKDTTVSQTIKEVHVVHTLPEDFFNNAEVMNAVNETIQSIEEDCRDQGEMDKAYNVFIDTVFTEMDKRLPVKCVKSDMGHKSAKSFYKPYWSDELQNAWDTKVQAEKIWLKENGATKQRLKGEYCKHRKCFDRLLKKAKRQYQNSQIKELEDFFDTKDHAAFWKKIGKIGLANDRKQYIPWEVKTGEDDISTDHEVVLDRWQKDFSSIYQNVSTDNFTFDEEHLQSISNDVNVGNEVQIGNNSASLNVPITIDEVRKAIGRAKARKARGVDDIPAEVLKNDMCIDMLHKIITIAFKKGLVPSDWQRGIIHPIPKSSSKDPRDPLNYRGITLISIPCKIYCMILNDRLSKWLEANNILVEEQNGFRHNRSCLDHLYTLHNTINYQKNQKKSAFVCFVDAKKAFDSVNRVCLWYKLKQIGLHGTMLNAIKSLYDNVECAVRLNGSLSKWFKVPNGVKQGCVLSPSLFAIFLNDLAEDIINLHCGIKVGDTEVSILMFADDIALLADSEHKLQQMLNCVYMWCRKWRMCLNMDKTKIVHFRHKSQNRSKTEFKFGTDTVQMSEKYKYLGLWLSEHLNVMDTVKPLAASAGRALGALITKYKHFGGMSFNIFTRLYDSLVSPVLNYGAGIWGNVNLQCANTVQNRACRFFLGVGSKTSNVATRGEMGWKPQVHRQYLEVLRLHCRLEQLPLYRLNSKIHHFSTTSKNRSLWENKVKMLFHKLDFNLPYGEFSQGLTLKNFQLTLEMKDQNDWWHELHNDKNCPNGNKLRKYRLHKCRMDAEHYVKYLSKLERSTLAKLRCGSLPLNIECGRFTNTPIESRICDLCDTQLIEDEIHFTIECTFYDDLRHELFNNFSQMYDDFMDQAALAKYCIIMCENSLYKLVATTIHKMFQRRQSFV